MKTFLPGIPFLLQYFVHITEGLWVAVAPAREGTVRGIPA